jgi:transposase
MILLKADKETLKQIGEQLGCNLVSVNFWGKRYQSEGIAGLHIKEGRGRPAILRKETDLPAVRAAEHANRQRLSVTQETVQAELGKSFSPLTLKRFLRKTVAAVGNVASADTSEYRGE